MHYMLPDYCTHPKKKITGINSEKPKTFYTADSPRPYSRKGILNPKLPLEQSKEDWLAGKLFFPYLDVVDVTLSFGQ